jgi:hypothetical protein
MADNDAGDGEEADAEDEPVVELGEGEPVEGAPLARVASRLTWGMPRSELERRVGDTAIRTPDGPRELSDVLDGIDDTYFPRRQAFIDAVHGIVGSGPVPTADGSTSTGSSPAGDPATDGSSADAESTDAEAASADE